MSDTRSEDLLPPEKEGFYIQFIRRASKDSEIDLSGEKCTCDYRFVLCSYCTLRQSVLIQVLYGIYDREVSEVVVRLLKTEVFRGIPLTYEEAKVFRKKFIEIENANGNIHSTGPKRIKVAFDAMKKEMTEEKTKKEMEERKDDGQGSFMD